MSANRIGALTGVAFILCVILGFAIGGEPPNPSDDSVQEIIDFYTDDDTKIWIGVVLESVAAALIVFFAGYLRKVIRAAAGEGHMLHSVVLAGATIFATGLALDATISVALLETVDDIAPGGVQALSALWSNDFIVFATGTLVMAVSLGLAVIRHGVLPKWMGWAALVLAVAMITPAGFAGFIGFALWILIASILLTMRADQTTTA